MIFDWDDFHEHNHKLERLWELKQLRPDFRCTVFAVPGLGSDAFWDSTPDWIELAVHGWVHPDPYECAVWSYSRMEQLLDELVVQRHFMHGFKAPGWQISDDCYQVLEERGWWVADHWQNNARRPAGIRAHVVGGANHWHGHVQDVCGNGLTETFETVRDLVRSAVSFELVSECVEPWKP